MICHSKIFLKTFLKNPHVSEKKRNKKRGYVFKHIFSKVEKFLFESTNSIEKNLKNNRNLLEKY